jgi:CBS domain-containing protein
MLSYSDLLRISFADATDETGDYVESTVYDMFSLEQVMTSKVVCVESDDTIKDVAEILAKEHFHALPVIEHDKLIGIITSTDIINFFLESFY